MSSGADLEVRFRTGALQRLCNSHANLIARWGVKNAALVSQCLQELEAVERLGDLTLLPYVHVSLDKASAARLDIYGSGVRLRLALDPTTHKGLQAWKVCTGATVLEIEVMEVMP